MTDGKSSFKFYTDPVSSVGGCILKAKPNRLLHAILTKHTQPYTLYMGVHIYES